MLFIKDKSIMLLLTTDFYEAIIRQFSRKINLLYVETIIFAHLEWRSLGYLPTVQGGKVTGVCSSEDQPGYAQSATN
jgi:hypothetical protein